MKPEETILNNIKAGKIKTRKQLDKAKKETGKKHGLDRIMQNSDIIKLMTKEEIEKYSKLLVKKPSRSISGVNAIAVMSKPGKCPHGKCIMCPGVKDVPESYTGKEPATMRAISNNFDPYKQVFDRLKQYYTVGHEPSKIELIIMGGTFLSYEKKYKDWFVARCYQALNDYPDYSEKEKTLEEVKKENENAKHRCIALVFETRPDCLDINEILNYGGTRVEIGVQSLNETVLKKIERGHGIKEVKEATKKIRNAGLKVDYHVMLKLPGSNEKEDIATFRELFENENYRPDGLKIYPTLITEGTKLHEMWKKGEYEECSNEYVIQVLSQAKTFVPEYVRIKRIMRDIPNTQIIKGPTAGNIREQIWKKMKTSCKCIRCREIGRKQINSITPELRLLKYKANEGDEYFISYNDKKTDALIGFLRLRIYDKKAFIRELHVYGTQTPVGERRKGFQHRGYGKKLIKKAEEIVTDRDINELNVNAGTGVKEYYRKLGYKDEQNYLTKRIQ